PLTLFGDIPLDELVAAEIELERDFLAVDLDITDLINLAGNYDVPVVLLSDTYFTEAQLTFLLGHPELTSLRNTHVFRSHQHGTRNKNELWQTVCSELDVHPEQLVHIGNVDHLD